MREKIALQLFTLREACKTDFPGVLRQVSQMGYAGVQFAGFHGFDPVELKGVMRETGLRAAGMHVGWDDLVERTDKAIADAKLMETPDIICPVLKPDVRTEEGYREVKRQLNEIAKRLRQEGCRLSYHNHAFEFETQIEGKDALSYLLAPAPDNDILAELDVYWLQKGGYDPVAYLQPYAGRMPIIHLKDMTADEEQTFAEIGTGVIDFKPILRWGEASEVEWYVVEQDQCSTNPMDCVRTSYANLLKLIADINGEEQEDEQT